MQKSENVETIAKAARGGSSSTYLLQSAIQNPKVILVYWDKRTAEYFKEIYLEMVEESMKKSWWNRFLSKLYTPTVKSKDMPIFASLSADLRGYRRPVVFDNSALIKR